MDVRLVGAGLAAGLVLTGCAGGTSTAQPADRQAQAPTYDAVDDADPSSANVADIAFVSDLFFSLPAGAELARAAVDRVQREDVRAFAVRSAQVRDGQSSRVAALSRAYALDTGGRHVLQAPAVVALRDAVAAMAAVGPDDADRFFLTTLRAQNADVADLVDDAARTGRHEESVALARDVQRNQQDENAEAARLLDELGPRAAR